MQTGHLISHKIGAVALSRQTKGKRRQSLALRSEESQPHLFCSFSVLHTSSICIFVKFSHASRPPTSSKSAVGWSGRHGMPWRMLMHRTKEVPPTSRNALSHFFQIADCNHLFLRPSLRMSSCYRFGVTPDVGSLPAAVAWCGPAGGDHSSTTPC